MTKFPKATVEALNTKTGSTGWAVCSFKRNSDGKGVVEVFTGKGKPSYWLLENVELVGA